MSGRHIFISHASKDDGFVEELRGALEGVGLKVWDNTRDLRGGARLTPEVEDAIEQARQFVVVLSPDAVNSPWVRWEIQKALEVEGKRAGEGYRVIPLLLPGVEPSALSLWFDVEPVGLRVEVKAGGLSEALPAILAALGERVPDDPQPVQDVTPRPLEEIVLKLDSLTIETKDGQRRARAVAQLIYQPADKSVREVESRHFDFTAPLGVIEAEELRWYLEEFFIWPVGIFQERAARVEARLPRWGQDLYQAALAPPPAQEALNAWQQSGDNGERRFSVFVDSELPDSAGLEEQAAAGEAAAELLALPWELLHDGRGFLFHGARPVRVRRRLPNRYRQRVRPTQLPIRILLISPRPEDGRTPYIDHRISARPLVEALESLGELAKLSILTPPTFPALEEALRSAAAAGEPFDVVHFDGHGLYDRATGLGGLCFEDPNDAQKLELRALELVHAAKLAEVIRDQRIPLVFLEPCQTAKTEEVPTASVAAKLLEEGVASVVAMSHTVLVETARRFVKAFYLELAGGRRVGTAMIAGQRELHRDTYRGKLMGAGELRLQDWFVPVLYQEEQDPPLVTRLPSAEVRELQATQRRLSLGRLPDPPPHEFHGRSRELLALERLLDREPYAVIRGQGGEGKTALAVELARWLVRTARFQRAAFISLEPYMEARGVLEDLGRQLLPEGDGWSVTSYPDPKLAILPVEGVLRDRATIIVLDNVESVLPDRQGQQPAGTAPLEELFDLCRRLLDAHPATRIIFTSGEPLPAPFNDRRSEIVLGALRREDAVALVGEVMKGEGLTPKSDDPGGDPQEITELVEAVGRHARALVLLTREVARRGVRATTENLYQLMADLDRRHPNDRDNSLYASVELSLRRLPPEIRERIRPLAVFQGGAHLGVLAQMLDAEPAEVMRNLGRQLIEGGLAEDMGYGHLRLDPALAPYLLREMSGGEQEQFRAKWAATMSGLASFLYKQQFENAELSARLTVLELPNLLAVLSWTQERAAPETVVALAQDIETLVSGLGLQQALAQATRAREQAAQRLRAWGHARVLAERAAVDRLLERGEVQAADAAARELLERCLAAGEEAYTDANYDIAVAQFTLGRVLQMSGAAETALAALEEAGRRFEALANDGNESAELMTSVTLAALGDCRRDLGKLQEATATYEESITRAERLGNMRQVAAVKGQLGTANLLRKSFDRALESYEQARIIFESLGEQDSVSAAWNQIGSTYRQAGVFREAERALRQALAIKVQSKDSTGEANSLSELGVLYFEMHALEDSVRCYRQAADIFGRVRNLFFEGAARNNLAITLLAMRRYDEARAELLRSLECRESLGHVAQQWKTWNVLHRLEQVAGDMQAATEARQKAMQSFLQFRRDGGENLSPGATLCALVAEAVVSNETAGVEEELPRYLGAEAESWAKVMIPKLQAILNGERNPDLTADPDLDYDDAVELQLLLERLSQ